MIRPISTHSPRVGRTAETISQYLTLPNFNSLAPCGANRRKCYQLHARPKFQLTRPVWGEPDAAAVGRITAPISTHSPRVGRTYHTINEHRANVTFQLTRPVWGEPRATASITKKFPFQLTRPVWGEPAWTQDGRVHAVNFNSLAPCGANLFPARMVRINALYFNSLAPCGANRAASGHARPYRQFQLTRPVWGEPNNAPADNGATVYFNSLAPCGANPESTSSEP